MFHDCPFCIENGKVTVLKQNDDAYLVAAHDGHGVIMPGRYLIIPKAHIGHFWELPGDWMHTLNSLLVQIPEYRSRIDFNLSLNCGQEAGQRVWHMHFWVLFRQAEEGLPSHQLGLASLIAKING